MARISYLCALMVGCLPTLAFGQAKFSDEVQKLYPQATHSELGLFLPTGETPKPGASRRVIVPGLDDDPVIAEIYLEYESVFVVLLPNGYLKTVSKIKATETDRPFEPLSKKELMGDLLKKFAGFKTLATPQHVFVYNCSPKFARGTARIITTMYRKLFLYCGGIDAEAHEPRFPLVMVLFKTYDEFQKYHAMPPEVSAYYNGVSNQVIIYEQSQLTEDAPELAIKRAISVIAHEGVHQILHNVGVQKRLSDWPMWISEGLPEYFAPTQVTVKAKWKGIGEPNDLRMYELTQHLDEGSTELGIKSAVKSQRLDSLGYAQSWALVHYLGQRNRRNFFALLREMNQSIQPGQKGPKPGFFFEKHFGEDYGGLERKVMLHLQKTPYVDPIANQTHYVALAKSRQWTQGFATVSPSAIIEWQKQLSKKYPAGSVRFNVQTFRDRRAAQQFMRRTFPASR